MTENDVSRSVGRNTGPGNDPGAIPERIGHYRIRDVLGEGGMAIVYLAEQDEPVKRQVALKVIKPGMDTKQVVARFESERQALAVLDHPGIAKIFDGGVTDSGHSYFVMERVHGIPITEYCDQHRLDTNERIALFTDVCSAVQHAHHKGLIHRDLKPSNMLVGDVDGKPQVKIIDFGIAKAATPTMTEKTLFTRLGQIVGTPQYMSPEQADTSGLDVDTRSDIYSLGVVLYELLVGTVPLDLAKIGDEAMRFALREKDPAKPSTRITELGDTKDEVARTRRTDVGTLRRQLKGDLDWIVMQAIEKDRTRRYETANALAMDCRRFLKHEPVLARHPSAGYVLSRFVRRNRLMVTAASIAIVAIVAGAVAATLGFMRAVEAERIAVEERDTASATTNFLVDLFQVSDPWAFAPVRSKSGAEITAREVLDMGADRIRDALEDQPRIQANLMTAIGQVYMGLGLPDDARPLIEDGLEVRRSAYPPRHTAIADSLYAMGLLQHIYGNYAESAKLQEEAISIYRDAWGEDDADIARMLNMHAVTLSSAGRVDEALAVQQRALDLLRNDPEERPFVLGEALNNLGYVQNALSLHTEAMQSFEEAIEVLSKTQARGLYSRALANLAASYQQTGRLAEAKELHEESIDIKREWFGPHHIEVGYSVANLSYIYQEFGDYSAAERLKAEAIDIFSRNLGDQHPNIAVIMIGLGAAQNLQGKLEEAAGTYAEALERIRTALGPESMYAVIIHNGIGENLHDQGRYGEAEASYREALAIALKVNPEHTDVAVSYGRLARLPESTLTVDEREEYFEKAIELLQKNEGERSLRAAFYKADLAALLADQGREEEAKAHFEKGLATLSDALPADSPRLTARLDQYESLFGAR